MSVRILNPYSDGVHAWLKGNLHTHTGNSDGPHAPQATIDAYAASGYAFLMFSDHDFLTQLDGLDPRGMTLIPGNEITADGPHLLHVGAHRVVPPHPDRQRVIDAIGCDREFSIMCHPNWEAHYNHCPQQKLMEWQGYIGIEIYNGVVAWLEGSPTATDRWDRLLGNGRRLWGFAHDDCHRAEDIGVAWNVVQSDRRDLAAILDALRAGRFYASTGVTIDSISVSDHTIRVETADAHRISAFSDFGYRRAVADDRALTMIVPDDPPYTYIRFECAGCGDRNAWTQPFFLERQA